MSEDLGDFGDLLGGVGRVYQEDVTAEEAARTPAQLAFRKHRDLTAKINRMFSTKQGREVLRWLKSITIDRPVIPFEMIGVMSAEERLALAHFREGENELVRSIILAIKDHREGEDDET